jgi:hypothetical protein
LGSRIGTQSEIFASSQAGISHVPEEFTTAAECIAGGRVLLATLLKLGAK